MGQSSRRESPAGVDVSNSAYTNEYILKVMETLGVCMRITTMRTVSVHDLQWTGPAWKT